jgi:hypothetical protein
MEKLQPTFFASRFVDAIPITRAKAAEMLRKHRQHMTCSVSRLGVKTYKLQNNYFDMMGVSIQHLGRQ